MYNNIIVLDPARPNLPVAPVWVGQGGNGKVRLRGVPHGAAAVRFILTPVGATGGQAYAAAYDAATRDWVATLPGWAFPTAGQTRYEVLFTMGEGSEAETYSAGIGLLTVYVSALEAEIPDAPEVSDEVIITDPVTGKRYQLIARQNDIGQAAPELVEKT